MINFFQKRKIEKHQARAAEYIAEHFSAIKRFSALKDDAFVPETEQDVQYSFREDSAPQQGDVKYSLRESSDIRYSASSADAPKFSREEVEESIDCSVSTGPRFSREPDEDYSKNEPKFSRELDTSGLRFSTPLDPSLLADADLKELGITLKRSKQKTFVEKLMELIAKKGVTDPVVYRRAQIDRRLFSKMMSDVNYQPSKDTCIALALALKLSLKDTMDLLSRAGYTLSHSSRRDLIVEYFIIEAEFNLFVVNEVLTKMGEKKIGR